MTSRLAALEAAKDSRLRCKRLIRTGVAVMMLAPALNARASAEDLHRALLDAKSIAYLNVGSGLYIQGLLEPRLA